MLYPDANDDVCEATGCFEKPMTKIKLKVGERQTITLHICNNCVNKFDQKERVLESVVQPVSNTNQSIQSLSIISASNQEND